MNQDEFKVVDVNNLSTTQRGRPGHLENTKKIIRWKKELIRPKELCKIESQSLGLPIGLFNVPA